MTKEPTAWLSSIGYQLGNLIPIEALSISSQEQIVLKAKGLRTVSRIDRPMADLLPEVLRRQVSERGRPDIVIVATNSIRGAEMEGIARATAKEPQCADLPIQYVSGGDCTNVAQALRIGFAYLVSGMVRDCLILTADSAGAAVAGQPRAVFGGGLVGDAVAWCRLSCQPSNLALLSAPVIVKDVSVTDDAIVAMSLKGLRQAVRQLIPDRAAIQDIVQLLPNTYTNDNASLISTATHIPESLVYLGNVARTGHCFAADTLINLADWSSGTAETGRIMLLASGLFQWSACLLDRQAP